MRAKSPSFLGPSGSGALRLPSPLRTVRETFASYGSSISKVALVGQPATWPLPTPRRGCSFERVSFLAFRRRVDDASTALCLSSPCCPDPSPTPIWKLSVSVHDWMGFAPRHQRDGSTPSSGTGGNTPDAINSVSLHLLLAYSRSRPRVATNAHLDRLRCRQGEQYGPRCCWQTSTP